MDFRERLIKITAERRLSQQQHADVLDVSTQTVSRCESGKSYPSIQQLANICREFKIDANELLDCGENSAPTVQEKTQNKERAKKSYRLRLAAIVGLGILLAAAIGGLIATIVYAVKDASYDSSATVWIVSIPQNTPMIVLSVLLGLFILLIAAMFAYIIFKGKRK